MKKKLLSAIKIIIPLSLGIFVMWYVFQGMTQNEQEIMFNTFKEAKYFWIFLSIVCGVLSHMSRAYRWKYLQEPLGYKFNFWNAFFGVMVGYFANLLIPRIGEIIRCSVVARAEGKDVKKLIGTVVAERAFDMIMLLIGIAVVLFLEFDLLNGLLVSMMGDFDPSQMIKKVLIAGSVLLLVAVLGFLILKKFSNAFFLKVKAFVLDIWQGVSTVFKLKKVTYFIAHSLFIWLMYILMIYVAFFSVENLSNLPFMSVMSSFVMGGIAMVFVQGGVGVYPVAVMKTLELYSVDAPIGLAIGWIVWTAQTAMMIVLGSASLLILPIYNRKSVKLNKAL